MKLGANHPMGPLALGDLIGLDVVLAIMDTLFNETKDGKYQSYMEAKMQIMSSASKDNGDFLYLSAALDEAYARHTGRGGAAKRIDTWV